MSSTSTENSVFSRQVRAIREPKLAAASGTGHLELAYRPEVIARALALLEK